jgi:hypothetical protein
MRLFSALLAAALLAATPSFADWKSFIHGDPPPVVKAPPPKQIAVVASAPGAVPDAQVEGFLRAFADALMARDAAAVLPRLSPRYAIDGMPEGMKASDFMAQAIAKMRGPTEIVVLSVIASGGARTARVEFRYGAEKASLKQLRFDAEGRLLESDLFSLVRG